MKIFTFLISLLILSGCNPSTKTESTESIINKDSIIAETKYDCEPPFKKECPISFDDFGDYKISNDNFNVYYSGKGWDTSFCSCSWVWGEIISNQIPSDTNVTVLKVHLLDLDKFYLPKNMTEYGNDSLKKYVIAIYTREKDKMGICAFDPFNTGKYHKPKEWSE